jgi:hypothetical protein
MASGKEEAVVEAKHCIDRLLAEEAPVADRRREHPIPSSSSVFILWV